MRHLPLLALLACTPKAPPAAATDAPADEASTTAEVIKSPIDGRSYRTLELDNGLTALLIHDPDTDMAAASLHVHIGHYADPADRMGLAHFLEHMLFMGTDRYPDVEDYRKFIQGHGGSSNAGTGGEGTTYYFRVEQAHLDGAFDRFARFFVAPVLDPEFVDRERNAVHNEYSLKIRDEARRDRQVRKITTNPDHPESKFSVGNLDTLGDRDDDVVYEDLKALYDAQYRAGQMTVAILGRESLDELEAMVREDLSEVPAGEGEHPERPAPFLPEQLAVRIDTTPLEERREVELQFPLPSQNELWPKKPHSYLVTLLGDESEGTLAHQLRTQGLSDWLRTGLDGADDYDLFKINIGLTKEGAENLDDVVTAVFEAIRLAETEGISQERYDQLAAKSALDFAWAEEAPPVSAVRGPVYNLHYRDPEHALDAGYQWGSFDPIPIREALGRMVPLNLRLMVVLPEGESKETIDQTEVLYEVPYGVRPLSDDERATWKEADSRLDVAMPPLNPYLPEDTSLVDGGDEPGVPERLTDIKDPLHHYHLTDTSFGVPKAQVRLQLIAPSASTEEHVAAILYSELLQDELLTFTYPIRQAGLSLGTRADDQGLSISIGGYDDRIDNVLADTLDRIQAFEPREERFALIQEATARNWRNMARDRPISQTARAMRAALDVDSLNLVDEVDVLEALTLDDVKAWGDKLDGEIGAALLTHGNLTADESVVLGERVRERFQLVTSPPDPAGVRDIPDGERIVRDVAIDHADSSIVIAMMGNQRADNFRARWELLGQVLKTPFFGELRTKQQLGYVASAYSCEFDVWPGLCMYIQSSNTDPVTLEERIDAFLEDQKEAIAQMPEEEFEATRAGLVAQLREAPTRLSQRTGRLASDLYHQRLTFDSREVLAQQIETITKEDLLAFYGAAITRGRLVTRNLGTAHEADMKGGCADAACVDEALGETRRRPRF